MKKKELRIFLPFFAVICIELIFLFSISPKQLLIKGSNNILEKYASDIINKCFSSSYHPSCYDEEIPKLMDYVSMEDSFQVTKLVQDRDPTYSYCHVLGHTLSARETAKDPSKWEAVVARCPSGLCSNGCIHGAFQERFRTDALPDAKISELKPVLENVCEARSGWNPTGMEQASCYHALGHLTMYITAADIKKSTNLCEEIALKPNGRDFSQLCFDGAFMQIFQPLEPEDFALIKGKEVKKPELPFFCSNFSGRKKGSCWNEGWPLFREEIKAPEGLVAFCSFLKDSEEQSRCYSAMFYVLTAQFNFDEGSIEGFCNKLPQEERKAQCFANAASRMIESDWRLIDKSVNICSIAAGLNVGKECYEELLLYSTYNFRPGSDEFIKLCNALPTPWNTKCLAKSPR